MPEEKRMSRRDFLKLAGVAGAGLTVAGGLGGLVAACGGGETTTTAAAATTTTAAAATTTTAAAAATTTSGVKVAHKTLKIGCIMPQSGSYGFYGISMKPSIERYMEIINENGGVEIGSDVYDIEMKFPDDAADPKRGPICVQELHDWGAVANVGSFSQAQGMVAAMTPLKMINVGKQVSGIDLKQAPYMIGGLDEQGENCYNFLCAPKIFPDMKYYGITTYDYQVTALTEGRTLIMSGEDGLNPDTPYTKGLIKVDEVNSWPSSGNQDWGGLLAKYHSMGVDTIDCTYGPQDYALISKQAGDLGYKFNWTSAGTMSDIVQFVKTAGQENAQGMCCVWPVPWLFQENQPIQELQDIAKKICDREKTRTGLEFNQQYMGGFEYGINHLRDLLEIYKKAGSIDPDAAMEAVIGITIDNFHGKVTANGVHCWKDTARIFPSHLMIGKIVKDHFEYAAEAVWATPDW
jgi:hypothetical protein